LELPPLFPTGCEKIKILGVGVMIKRILFVTICLFSISTYASECFIPPFLSEGNYIEFNGNQGLVLKAEYTVCWLKVQGTNKKVFWVNVNNIQWV